MPFRTMESDSIRPRTRRISVRLLVLVTSVLGALLATEVFARTFDPFGISYYKDTNRYLNEAIVLPPEAARPDGRLFENAPGAELDCATFRFRTDEHGLRRGQLEPRQKGDRILFLGDSVTLAWGVDDEASWIRTVEREALAPDGERLVCLNAGHLQYNTLQEADWLRAHVAELAPDRVVLTVVVNDLEDAWSLYVSFMDELARRPPPGEVGLLASLRERFPVWFRGLYGLAHFVSEQRSARTAAQRSNERLVDQPGYAQGWERCAEGLASIRAICDELGLPFAVFDHTTPRVPDLATWCAQHSVPSYDFDFEPAEWELDVRNSAADAHANELGNRLLADKALLALRDLGWIRAAESTR